MKWKKILLMSLMAILLIGLAEAATIEGTPATAGVIGCNANLSVELSTELENLTHAFWYFFSLETPNNTYTSEAIVTVDASDTDNNSQHLDYTAFDTGKYLMDGGNYSFKIIAGNSTNNYTDTNTGITVDCSVPVCTDNSGFSRGDTIAPDATWSFTGGNTTSGSISFGGNNYALTKGAFTGRNLALSFSSRVPEQIYTVTATITDGTNSTTCTPIDYVKLQDSEGAKRGVAVSVAKAKKFDPLIIIIALIAVFALKGKKKK